VDDPLEIEVKFYLFDADRTREDILALGAAPMGRTFETNTCFEDKEKTFKARDILLRLRKDDKARLTFKSPPRTGDSEFKVYRELEVIVDDFENCHALLEALGFSPARRYEKWRETFLYGDTKLLVDTTPVGVFLEIEGDKANIRALAGRLNLKWNHRILLNYLAIFEIVCKGAGLPFGDMTFENVRFPGLDMEACLPLLSPS
jgi:adenylate cyclase class 2